MRIKLLKEFKELKKEILKEQLSKHDRADIKACECLNDLQDTQLYEENVIYYQSKIVNAGSEAEYKLYKSGGETEDWDYSDYEYNRCELLGITFFINDDNMLITEEDFDNAIDDRYYIQNTIDEFCEETYVDDCDVTVHYNKNSGTGNYYYFRITTLDLDYTSEYLDVQEYRELLAHAIF